MVTKMNIIKNGKSLSFEAVEDPNGSFVLASDYASLFAELDLAKADRDAQQKRADALAVENAGLKAAGNKMFLSAISLMEDPELIINHLRDVKDWERNETPATYAAIAAIEARGADKFAAHLWKRGNELVAKGGKKNEVIRVRVAAKMAEMFAAELREAK